MRKKILLQQLQEAIEQNGELNEKLKQCEEQIRALQEVRNTLQETLNQMQREEWLAGENQSELPQEPTASEEPTVTQEPTVSQEPAETVEPEIKTEPDTKEIQTAPIETEDGILDVSALRSFPVSKEMEYATEAIGEIVVKCAEACNQFAKAGGAAARERINLALGKTEVFKGDCLTIASSKTAFSVKKECIDRIKSDTETYFEVLKQQQ